MKPKSSAPGNLLAGGVAAAVLTVALAHPTPGPGPGPNPPGPGPDPTGSYLVAVTDNTTRTPEQAAILDSDDLWTWLTTKKIPRWTIDKDAAQFTADGYDKLLAADGIAPPCFVLWSPDRSTHKTIAFPATVDALKQWIVGSPHTGPPFIEVDGEKRYLTRLPPSEAKFMAPRGGEFGDVHAPIPRAAWKEVNNRAKFPPEKWIYDQDGIGSCVGNGSTAALRKARFLAGYTDVRLAPGCTYAQINGGRDQGAVISDSLTALQQTGTISAATLGSDEKPFYLKQMPSGWKTEAARFRIEEAYHCANFDEMCTAVQLGYIVVFGIQVGQSFNHFSADGVPGATPGPGNHCLHADGVHKLSDGTWALDTCNSWGASWGPDKVGRCYLIERHFQQGDVPDAWACKTAVVDPQDPLHPPKKVRFDDAVIGAAVGPAIWLVRYEPEKQATHEPPPRCSCYPCKKGSCADDCPCVKSGKRCAADECTCNNTPRPGIAHPSPLPADDGGPPWIWDDKRQGYYRWRNVPARSDPQPYPEPPWPPPTPPWPPIPPIPRRPPVGAPVPLRSQFVLPQNCGPRG
jgi:hypothetical protein